MTAANPPHSECKKDKFVQIKDGLCPDLAVGGIGIDVFEVGRMRSQLSRQRDLLEGLFTTGEIAHGRSTADPVAHYASCFALKEAFLKALGTGWQYGIGFREIEIEINAANHICINLTGKAAELADQRGVRAIHASMSVTGDLAVATVILGIINGKGKDTMSNIGSYEERLRNFDWSIAERELQYSPGNPINIGWYCTDRICRLGKGNKKALIWEDSTGRTKVYTYDELRIATNTFAFFLQKLGVRSGDRVCLFMDRIPELYIGFLGVLKLGAIAQPLFSAFGEESLHVRLSDASTSVVITQRKHALKIRKISDQLPNLREVVVVDHDGKKQLTELEVGFSLDDARPIQEFESYPTTGECPSVLHYTSGTTGQPKGVKHVHYSLISQYLTAKWVLDLRDDDIYWCTADPGWVTGTSYGIIAPFALGVTQCVLDCGFSADAWYQFIQKHRISMWYSAPTAIRSLMKAGDETPKKYDLSSLRHLASVGEPLNAEAVIWSERVLGLPFLDTYWQTETGSIMITNFPGMRIKPGSMGKAFPGITAVVLDANTHEPITQPGKVGLIAFRPGWPAMMRTYWNNEATYQKKFRNGWYLSGDRARLDNEGYFWFTGRDDDIINTGGHLVSPFEVESALLEHPAVAESAVVAKPDDVNMEVVKAFVTLRPGNQASPELELDIMNFIRKRLSSLAMPQEIEYVDTLPKTRSGKIMRRVLHAREWGEEIGDLSTLEND